MITLKINRVRTQDYQLKLKMSMKIIATVKKCLTLVIIQLSQNNILIQTN